MSDESEFEEVPDDEKLRIVKHYLMSAPPGQIGTMLKDIKTLVPSHLLTVAILDEIFAAYNTKVCLPVYLPDRDRRMIICKEGQVDSNHYVDVINKEVVGFAHAEQKVIPGDVTSAEGRFNMAIEDKRLELQQSLNKYLESQYSNQGAVAVYSKEGTSLLDIIISCDRLNLRNFWAGKWQSRWTIDAINSPTKLSGSIELHVHYFENGNLQLQQAKNVVVDVVYHETNFGEIIASTIKSEEDIIQGSLQEMYNNMTQETFKEMRRVMPVTQQKMDWNIQTHRTARGIRS